MAFTDVVNRVWTLRAAADRLDRISSQFRALGMIKAADNIDYEADLIRQTAEALKADAFADTEKGLKDAQANTASLLQAILSGVIVKPPEKT